MQSTKTLEMLESQLSNLEQQNRKLRILTIIALVSILVVALAAISAFLWWRSHPSRTADIQKLILRDSESRPRVEIAVSYDSDSAGEPVVRLLDSKGREGIVLSLKEPQNNEHNRALLFSDHLDFSKLQQVGYGSGYVRYQL